MRIERPPRRARTSQHRVQTGGIRMGGRGEVHSELRFHLRPSSPAAVVVVVVVVARAFQRCERKEGGGGNGIGGGVGAEYRRSDRWYGTIGGGGASEMRGLLASWERVVRCSGRGGGRTRSTMMAEGIVNLVIGHPGLGSSHGNNRKEERIRLGINEREESSRWFSSISVYSMLSCARVRPMCSCGVTFTNIYMVGSTSVRWTPEIIVRDRVGPSFPIAATTRAALSSRPVTRSRIRRAPFSFPCCRRRRRRCRCRCRNDTSP